MCQMMRWKIDCGNELEMTIDFFCLQADACLSHRVGSRGTMNTKKQNFEEEEEKEQFREGSLIFIIELE